MSDDGTGEVRSLIDEWIEDRLHDFLPETLWPSENELRDIADEIAADLRKCTKEDKSKEEYSEAFVFKTSGCVHAIGKYRIAHRLLALAEESAGGAQEGIEEAAFAIYESAASATGIDIHPEAEIGIPFRIDHGRGTVIGQQVRIGRDCSLLDRVTLGAYRMDPKEEEAGDSRRHPTLGDGVKLYGGVSVFGDVTVHDRAEVGPGCTIKSNVPAGCTVKLISQLQVASSPDCHEVHGLYWPGKNRLEIWGSELSGVSASLVDTSHEELEGVVCEVTDRSDRFLSLEVTVPEPGLEVLAPPRLKLVGEVGEVVVMEGIALYQLWSECDEISREAAPSRTTS